MEFLEKVLSQIEVYISVPYLVIFMLLAYTIKKYFSEILERITLLKWKCVYTVLLIATLTAVPFLLWSEEGWLKIVFSYAVGTSLHELIFFWIEKKISAIRNSV